MKRQIDRELDNSRYNGRRREDQINGIADRFNDAVFDLDDDGRLNSNELRRVMDLGAQLDRAVSQSRLSYNVKRQMSAVRNNLRSLGNYNYNNGNNNRNGGWNNGNNNRNNRWPF